MNRGSSGLPPLSGTAPPGFNEAPIHESGKWGAGSQSFGRLFPASMRPRFMNRGSQPDHAHRRDRDPASMRPRFMNRGSPPDSPEGDQ